MTLADGVVPTGATVVGAIVGSFLATLVIRWQRGRSVVRGRSCCDTCGRLLSARELVPLLSFALARGRCGRCGGAIDRRHSFIEAAAGLIGGAALALQPGLAGWAGALFGWGLLVLGAIDLACFWLPDALTLPLALAGWAAGGLAIWPPVSDRLIGAAAGYASLALLRWAYRRLRGREGMGGGDPKLLAAIGAWLGWQPLPLVVLVAALAGIGWFGIRRLRGVPVSLHDRLPLGTLLAGGAWLVWIIYALARVSPLAV